MKREEKMTENPKEPFEPAVMEVIILKEDIIVTSGNGFEARMVWDRDIF